MAVEESALETERQGGHRRVDRGGGEHAGQQGPEGSAHHVNRDHIERVVVAEPGLEADRQATDDAGDDPEYD
jgi:hypothetical protein